MKRTHPFIGIVLTKKIDMSQILLTHHLVGQNISQNISDYNKKSNKRDRKVVRSLKSQRQHILRRIKVDQFLKIWWIQNMNLKARPMEDLMIWYFNRSSQIFQQKDHIQKRPKSHPKIIRVVKRSQGRDPIRVKIRHPQSNMRNTKSNKRSLSTFNPRMTKILDGAQVLLSSSQLRPLKLWVISPRCLLLATFLLYHPPNKD